MSNQKAKIVPREHDIYHRIMPYVIVFDTAGDFNHSTGAEAQGVIKCLMISPGWYHESDELLVNFQTSKKAILLNYEATFEQRYH